MLKIVVLKMKYLLIKHSHSSLCVEADAQISEVAKMLYQQGLTELIHSSPSEQVAYLLVERASLLEKKEDPDNLAGHEDASPASPLATKTTVPSDNTHQVRGTSNAPIGVLVISCLVFGISP